MQRQEQGLALALDALRSCSGHWEQLKTLVDAAKPSYLVAGLLDRPELVLAPAADRPREVTVVATDGSQIYPERHLDPTCYLLNISRIAFQYGTLEAPLMEATPELRYRRQDLEGLFENKTESITASIVSAIRDNKELEALFATALEARIADRPIVSLADGTLIRWMLSGLNNPALEEELITQYIETLNLFFQEGLPVCSYISNPGNTEVVNLLRWYLEHTPEGRTLGGEADMLTGLRDAHVFERILASGHRSVLFKAASHIQKRYRLEDKICYFYIRVPAPGGSEIARVEVPQWVASSQAYIALIHAVILDQVEKGRGYPIILSEAHERAVVRGQDTAIFYHLLDAQLRASGMAPIKESFKRRSKQRPLI